MSVDMMGNVTGRSDAIGPQEQFECVFEEDKVAFETYNGCYLSLNEDGQLSASKKLLERRRHFMFGPVFQKCKCYYFITL